MKASSASMRSRWFLYAFISCVRRSSFCVHVLFVVAVVDVHALVPELDGLVDGDVEEVAVVRDEDVGVGVVVEIVFEPVAGFEVEVVGGLVEQQQAGFLQQQLGERDAHLPAAGELFGLALPVFLGEAEAAEDGADLRVERVDVVDVELVGDVGVAVGGGGVLLGFRVGGGEGVGELFGFALEGVEVVEDGEALGEDGFAAQGEAVLREVAEGHAFDAGELAVVEGFDAAEDFEQRGFAGAVAADEAGALVRRDQPVDVFKEEFLAEAFAGGGELEHSLLFSHPKLGMLPVRTASALDVCIETPSYRWMRTRPSSSSTGPVLEPTPAVSHPAAGQTASAASPMGVVGDLDRHRVRCCVPCRAGMGSAQCRAHSAAARDREPRTALPVPR